MQVNLPENIRACRKSHGLTQERLAEALGVTVGAVSKWEAGLSTPELSLIVDMADLFETSVDVLLGYDWKGGNMGATLERLETLHREKQYDEAQREAEKAVKKYPNCFDIVYRSALICADRGTACRDKKASRRALELFDRACGLMEQNRDETVSELSIRNRMAQTHLWLGNTQKCLDILKRNNLCGINNARIGLVLADGYHRTEEAAPYLSKALRQCLEDMESILMGYASVFFCRRDYQAIVDSFLWQRQIFRGNEPADKPVWFDKYDCILLEICAEGCLMMGKRDEAHDYLKEAAEIALRFDRTPVERISPVGLFGTLGITDQPHYDQYGKTAMDVLKWRIDADADGIPGLRTLWTQVQKEVD